jgi:hypothetical protein
MRYVFHSQNRTILAGLFVIVFVSGLIAGHTGQDSQVILEDILPAVEGMAATGSPQTYFPETLFEYINGAAEIYLSYNFKELIVAEYKKRDSADSVAVEIYDMGNHKNSFGIYSAERYPDNEFLNLGTQGYMEGGALNFLIGRYYVKLLCFDCEDRSDRWLRDFSEGIVNRVEKGEGFPAYLNVFPREGILANTEKFILRNVMGYKFLHDGYFVSYEMKDLTFDCFLIEGENPQEATEMMEKYLEAKGSDSVQKVPSGYLIKDRYYQNIYLSQVDNLLCGVMKIPEGFEKIGENYIAKLIESVKMMDE